MPEPEPEVAANPYMVPREAGTVDDGQLHPRPRDVAFAGAPRGSVLALPDRRRITKDSIGGLRTMQVGGAAAFTLLCWFIAVTGILGDGSWSVGACIVLGALVPVLTRAVIHAQLRCEFWDEWCLSRGFAGGAANGPGKLLPSNLNRSPLIGPLESRHFELVARRRMCGREAVVGCILRVLPPADDLDPATTPTYHRAMFVVMPIPEIAAARWAGVSIRADHHARRPLLHRAMLGTLVASGVPDARAHVAAVAEQDQHVLHRLVDARLDQYLADHPMDVDIVGDLLVVTRDGAPEEADVLDELCRDALLLHEQLVAEHELPHVEEAPETVVAVPDEDRPVVDTEREGWGEQVRELEFDNAAYEQQQADQRGQQQLARQQAWEQQLMEQQQVLQQMDEATWAQLAPEQQQQFMQLQAQFEQGLREYQAWQQQAQATQQQGWDDGLQMAA